MELSRKHWSHCSYTSYRWLHVIFANTSKETAWHSVYLTLYNTAANWWPTHPVAVKTEIKSFWSSIHARTHETLTIPSHVPASTCERTIEEHTKPCIHMTYSRSTRVAADKPCSNHCKRKVKLHVLKWEEEGKRYCAAGWVSVKLVQPRQRGCCWNCKVDYLVGDRAITGSWCEPTIVLRQQRFTLRLYLLHGVTGCLMEYHACRERSGKGLTEKQG